MNTKGLWSAAILGAVTALFSACGDGDSTKVKVCNAKQITCLNEQGGEVCNADGTQNLPFSCGEGQYCCDPKAKGASCGTDVKAASCVGDCTPGATQCGGTGVSLTCSENGQSWVPANCPVGTGCDDTKGSQTYGTCVRNDDVQSVTVCAKGDATCANDKTAKTCEDDGSAWIYTACSSNETCKDGDCIVDDSKGCVPHSGTCVDATHVKTCNDDGDAYDDVAACPKKTTCEDGACQGPVCAPGAVRCDDVRVGSGFLNAITAGSYQARTLYKCNGDGTGWELSECASDEICVYDGISASTVNAYIQDLIAAMRPDSTAQSLPTLDVPSSSRGSCQVPDCATPFALRGVFGNNTVNHNATAGSFTCGDGTKPGDDTLDSYSLCEGLPPFNNLHWANYQCAKGEECAYQGSPATSNSYGSLSGPTCTKTCVAGTTACFTAGNGTPGPVSTYGESTVECVADKDGHTSWDYANPTKCVDKGRERWCGPNLQGTSDNYNIGTCMDPACAAWFSVYDTFTLPEHVGACGTDGKFYACNPDGTLGEAEDCSECRLATSSELPQVTGVPETFGGYDPGRCATCTDGAARCVFSSGQTPYYQTCKGGLWSTESCSKGALCWDYVNDAGLASKQCGADCAPNSAVCGGDDGKQIATCDSDGKMGDFKACSTGACHADSVASPINSGQAYCETECIPGSAQCTTALDPDNGDVPAPAAVSCTSKSRYDVLNPKLCDWTNLQNPERCIDKLGCVECDSGKFSGKPEVRCALDSDGVPVEPAAVQVCKDGHWDKAIACPGSGASCFSGACSSNGPSDGEGGAGGVPNSPGGNGGTPQL